jgi:transcriptional regulator with XRE-family HTH domain
VRRSTFGKIVAALRKERFDPIQGRAWTQRHLAQAANLSERLVANIERGDKVHLEPDVLAGLADAFSLTTLERREFYALAAEVTNDQTVNSTHDPQQIRAQVNTVINGIHLPGFVYDDYFDIVAANHASLVLHGIPSEWLQQLAAEHGAANFMHVIFAHDSPMRRSMARNWEALALGNMSQFRTMSLRQRHTRRFQVLFARLCVLPDFFSCWSSAQHAQSDFASRMRIHHYPHPVYGMLFYSVFAVTSYSAHNHLHVTSLLPLDDRTVEVFNTIYSQRPGHVLHLSAWPQAEAEVDDGEGI